MLKLPVSPDPDRIAADYREIAEKIGVRYAGSPEERAAGEYMRDIFRKLGAQTAIENFPVRCREIEREEIEVKIGKHRQRFAGSLLGSSPVPADSKSAPLLYFYSEVDYQRPDLSYLRGKAVVHVGCHIKNRENYRRLIAARPAFLIFTDTRFPGVTPTADGLFPAYVRDIGAVPTICAAYFDVWSWLKQGAESARLLVAGEVARRQSLNVVAEFPGSDPDGEIIFTGSHIDTQAATPGADDNGSGMVFQLELARVLAPCKLKRTVRHLGFGAEEQLSVGSAVYVRKHRAEIEKRGRFMFNADSCGSLLGWTKINYNGPERIRTLLDPEFHAGDLYVDYTREAIPFTDQFPFVMCGVPGIWLSRSNCASGQWYHHRPENNVDVVSPEVMAAYVEAAARFILKTANAATFPIRKTIPAAQMKQFEPAWQDLFGGWR